MSEETKNKKIVLDFNAIFKALLAKKKTFFIVWGVVFVLSCVIIFPQPRYYTCDVSIAPESSDAAEAGGLASLASSFGIGGGNLGSTDAIFPELYPDLFSSNDFLVDLLDIKVTFEEDSVAKTTDYYDYLKTYQKTNFLTYPFRYVMRQIGEMFKKPQAPIKGKNGRRFDPFHLTPEVDGIVQQVSHNITCNYSKTTGVVTITVKDQDPVVCATLADSVKERLQDFITDYRTKKARIDYEHYKELTAEAKAQYDKVRQLYASYSDANMDVILQSVRAKQTDLENEMQLKYNIYTSMNTNLEAAMAKVQERTPAFTTLKCASVPIKPAGPKRLIFIVAMLFLSTIVTACWQFRKEFIEWF